jgi:hypothetical protein
MAATPFLVRMVGEIPESIAMERIDRVWVFPPRSVGEVESGLVVLALRAEGERTGDQREVVTVQYELRSEKGVAVPVREVTGRGWAPADRVPAMIAGVVRRLGGEEEEPRTASIEGDAGRWNRFMEEVSDGMVDRASGE